MWTSEPPELLGRDVLAGRGLHERRSAQEDRAGPANDDRLVAHRRDIGPAGRARAHDERDLRDPGGRHPGLVVEDATEVIAVREDIRLEREERATAVDEIDARQPILEGDLLGSKVLLDRHRVVGAAFDGRVVGDDDAGRALDPADAGDDARAGRVVVVQAGRGEGAQFQERAAGVREAVDALPDGQLAALAMALDGAVVAAGAATRDLGLASAQIGDEGRHRLVVRAGSPGRPDRVGCAGRPSADDRRAPRICRARPMARRAPRDHMRHRNPARRSSGSPHAQNGHRARASWSDGARHAPMSERTGAPCPIWS